MNAIDDSAIALASSTYPLIAEVERARAEYQGVMRTFQAHVVTLREALRGFCESLAYDLGDLAVRTVVAIHRGDPDDAYQSARLAVRCVRTIQETELLLYGTPVDPSGSGAQA